MKKIITLVLCVLLCFSTIAVAEEAAAPQAVTSVTGLFTVELPEGYQALSTDLIQAAMDKFGSKELQNANYDISALQNLDLTSGDYYYSEDFSRNFNVQVAPESGITTDTLESMADSLGLSLTEAYVDFGAAEEDCEAVGIELIGERPFYVYRVVLLKQPLSQYITADANGNMYTLTFTNMEEEAVPAILTSFQLVEE